MLVLGKHAFFTSSKLTDYSVTTVIIAIAIVDIIALL